MPRSLVNDVLIAASCREAGVTLVTDNRAISS
jgi:predicted nucleic acid-binding protein